MNLKLAFLILNSAMLAFLGSVNADGREQKLAGNWEVVSVDRDGLHLHGEIGQAPGDVITISFKKDVVIGSGVVINNVLPVMPNEFTDLKIASSNDFTFS